MVRVIAKDDRIEGGFLWVVTDYCVLPYHDIYHKKLIHKGRKP